MPVEAVSGALLVVEGAEYPPVPAGPLDFLDLLELRLSVHREYLTSSWLMSGLTSSRERIVPMVPAVALLLLKERYRPSGRGELVRFQADRLFLVDLNSVRAGVGDEEMAISVEGDRPRLAEELLRL